MRPVQLPQPIIETNLYALVTGQQTAMTETGICGACLDRCGVEVIVLAATEDYFDGVVHDVSDNEAIICNWCGLSVGQD